MSKKNNLYPKLRFKEFTKSWKKKKISSIANSFDTDRVPVTAKDRVEGSTPYYGANGIQDYVQGFTHEGEFVLLAEDGANDLKNYPVHYVNRQIWVNNHAHVLQGDSQILNNIFLKYSLKTIDMKPHLVGGGRAKLNANAMMNINIFLSDLAEQEKIGNFFKKIDEMIQLRKTKVDKMKDIKTAYLSEMFPKKGEKYPKKRFKGFTEAWKKKKLNDIANIVGGGTPRTNNSSYWHGDINWYSPTEIGNEVYVSNSSKKITKLGLNNSSANLLPKEKTILFTSRAGIGDRAILKENAATNQGFQSLVLKDQINTYFIYSMGHIIKRYAEENASGSTFLEISGKELGKMQIHIPVLEEQEKIGNFFNNLDDQILIEEKKLKKLKKIKDSYLEKIFI